MQGRTKRTMTKPISRNETTIPTLMTRKRKGNKISKTLPNKTCKPNLMSTGLMCSSS